MNIDCPNCGEENKIEFAENIICHSCNKTLAGHRYRKFKKPLIGAMSAFIIGGIGGYKADNYLSEQRYPLQVEYQLVDACVNLSGSILQRSALSQKKTTCICAVKGATGEVSYSEYRKNPTQFISHTLTAHLRNC